jgi:hypothetical protein
MYSHALDHHVGLLDLIIRLITSGLRWLLDGRVPWLELEECTDSLAHRPPHSPAMVKMIDIGVT